MITLYETTPKGLEAKSGAGDVIGNDTVWIDLFDPTAAEDNIVEKALGISIPTRAEMREIEASNRLYTENGATFMTAIVVHGIDAPVPQYSAMTFILTGRRLVTVRYVDYKARVHYLERVAKGDVTATSGCDIIVGLLEALVQRMADLVERVQDQSNQIANALFDLEGAAKPGPRRLDVLLKKVGAAGHITARAEESASSLERMLLYYAQACTNRAEDMRHMQRVDLVHNDIKSLMDHMRFLTDRSSFLLSATLGMISTEQNQIIKLFSVMAVMLMPPTLVASIYGMNFRHMPELAWIYGYPAAIAFMFVSGLIPFIYFRRKGWL